MLEIADLSGLWHRSLIVRAHGARDTATWVAWLQGPSFYIDLRVPAGRPSFRDVRCLSDITMAQAAWLARQEGFAGRLARDGDYFVWQRVMDYQPKALVADSGRLRIEGGVMIEEGRDVAYVEHWHRDESPGTPIVGAHLCDCVSRGDGFLMRAGARFMYARAGASASLPAGTHLGQWVEGAASLARAQALVDCEISFGSIAAARWTIERSSLPYREGAILDPELGEGSSHRCRTADVAADGTPTLRHWDIVDIEGDAAALAAPAMARA
jgi:hypothetical protein